MMGKKEFEEKGLMAGLMVSMINPLYGTGKVVVMYSDFCVLEGCSNGSEGCFGVGIN